MSSIAQDELGHAAALYGLLGELTGTDADALAYDREPDAYRHCRLLDHGRGDWAMTIARRFLYDTADAVRLEALVGGSWAPLADLVGKLVREERYHRMHAGAWLERLARDRERGTPAADRRPRASSDLMRRRSSRHSPASRHSSMPGSSMRPMAELERRWRAVIEPVLTDLGLPLPPPMRDPGRAGLDHGEPFRWLWRRIHRRSPRPIRERRGERGRRTSRCPIARTRRGPRAATRSLGAVPTARTSTPVDAAAVRAALAEVMDPELPMVSIVDLGMVGGVDVADAAHRRLGRADPRRAPADVRRLPGARSHPAMPSQARLECLRSPGGHRITFSPPWTTDRITAERPSRPGRGRHRRTERRRRRPLPVLPIRAGRHGFGVRTDPVPLALLLPRLSPAVRSDEARLSPGGHRDRRHRRRRDDGGGHRPGRARGRPRRPPQRHRRRERSSAAASGSATASNAVRAGSTSIPTPPTMGRGADRDAAVDAVDRGRRRGSRARHRGRRRGPRRSSARSSGCSTAWHAGRHVLATNTSALSVAAIAAATTDPPECSDCISSTRRR